MTVAKKEPLVQIKDINKSFTSGDGNSMQVLFDINLDIYPGELTMIVGPSGCGKTTLLSIITGILTPTSGHVFINGINLTSLSDYEKTLFRRKNLGFIFQQYNLLPALTLCENAAVPLIAAGMDFKEAVGHGAQVLTDLGLEQHLGKTPLEISGGQQQRVAIARAIVHDPHVVVCDEPTAALDIKTGQAVLKTLRESALKEGHCAIVVTHDHRIFEYADRIIHIADGRIEKDEIIEKNS